MVEELTPSDTPRRTNNVFLLFKLDPKKTKISLFKKLSQHNSTKELFNYHKFEIYNAVNINLISILFNLFSDTN